MVDVGSMSQLLAQPIKTSSWAYFVTCRQSLSSICSFGSSSLILIFFSCCSISSQLQIGSVDILTMFSQLPNSCSDMHNWTSIWSHTCTHTGIPLFTNLMNFIIHLRKIGDTVSLSLSLSHTHTFSLRVLQLKRSALLFLCWHNMNKNLRTVLKLCWTPFCGICNIWEVLIHDFHAILSTSLNSVQAFIVLAIYLAVLFDIVRTTKSAWTFGSSLQF